jgi:hypothetical protein
VPILFQVACWYGFEKNEMSVHDALKGGDMIKATMTQCVLRKVDEPNTTTTAWIESRAAHYGYKVTLRENKKVWWSVESVGATLPEDVVLENSKDWQRTREASDI